MQRALTWLTLVCVLALLGPASALAANGPSAGDQQYIDPLTGTTHHSGSPGSSSGQATPTASPSPSTPASSTTPSSGVTTIAQATPTATTAASSTTTGASDAPGTLPRTGFDAWIGAAFGIGLLACGACLRWAVRRAP